MALPPLVLMAAPPWGTWTGALRLVQARGGGERANPPPVLMVSLQPGRDGAEVRWGSEEAGAREVRRDREEEEATEDELEETRSVPSLSESAVMGLHQTLQGGI